MPTVVEWAKELLLGTTLESKLTALPITASVGEWKQFELPQGPGRPDHLKFSEDQVKFPKRPQLLKPEGRRVAFHSFANHELLAIEMMAAAILIYPGDDRLKRGIATAIRDEQLHLSMYRKSMNDDGIDFGDYPVNDFFWRQMHKLKTPSQFFALMALTFESANLDFSWMYYTFFKENGDEKSAAILKKVHDDEITHVALGGHWLNQWREDKTLWEYYLSVLPPPNTPSRAKGPEFFADPRRKAGLDEDWIAHVENYREDFPVTQRKEWKK